MTKFEDNISPYVSFVEGSAPSSPAATNFKLYYDSADHLLKWKNSAGVVTTLATGGSAITTVAQDISADFTTSNDSSWHDVTGMTGISLVAGDWIGFIDVEHVCTTNYGPVFRITDGTNDYAQMGYIGNYLATVSTHQLMSVKKFTLGSTTSVKLQVYSDTIFTIKKYPTRGGLSTAVATHATFLKVA